MIVECGGPQGPRLVEPHDLKRFKVRLAGPQGAPADMAGIAIGDAGALVPIELVPTLPGAPGDRAWNAAYRAMVEAAAAHGWIDAERQAIRAHVERA